MGKNKALERIKSYLDERAKKDELFSQMYSKEGKNLEGCFGYIVEQARKRGQAVCMTDEEVFGLAVHYYCEDDLKEHPLPKNFKVSVSSGDKELDDEAVMKIRKEAVEEYKAQMKEMQKKGPVVKSAKKVAEVTAGMGSLFEF